jgi:D-aminopeptidase
VQEAGALFGVGDAATAARALGKHADAARHNAVFAEFQEALLRNVTANDVKVSAGYSSVAPALFNICK